MGLSIMFHGASDGDDGPFSLASASGWGLVTNWVETLPPKEYSTLWILVRTGEVDDTYQLSQELERALAEHPPSVPGVVHTLNHLQTTLGIGNPAEIATVVA